MPATTTEAAIAIDARTAPVADEPADPVQRRNARVVANQGLIKRVVVGFRGRGLDFDNLIQAGNLGLIRAGDKYDPGKGHAFGTYATPWIRKFVLKEIAASTRPIRLPAHALPIAAAYRKAAQGLVAADGAEPAVPEVLDAMGVPEARRALVRDVAAVSRARFVATPGVVADIRDDAGPGPSAREDAARTVHLLLARLDDRSRAVLVRRYGLDGEPPDGVAAIARRLGLGRKRVYQIHDAAIELMRRPFERERCG